MIRLVLDQLLLVGAALGVLSELDIELVLVSHGEPALRHGGAALARALHATPAPG